MTKVVDHSKLRWLAPSLFLTGLAIAIWRIPTPPSVSFQPPPISAEQMKIEIIRASAAIPGMKPNPSAPALTRLTDGRQAMVWMSADRHTPEFGAIWFSRQDKKGQWTTPLEIATRASTAGGSFAHVRQLSSPILHAEGSWLTLWYIGHALGDWGGAALYQSVSTDGGLTWTLPRRLAFSAGSNFGRRGLLPPIPLADGGMALPVTHEHPERPVFWLRFSATGQLIDQVTATPDDPVLTGRSTRPLEIPQ